MRVVRYALFLCFLIMVAGCSTPAPKPISPPPKYYTFEEVQSLVKAHTDPVILGQGDSRVLVAPAYAGRVMGATLSGEQGLSLGWIHPDFITGKAQSEQFVNYGGAERLWLSPEGGQFSLYFKPHADFSFSQWFVPACFNNALFPIQDRSETHVTMARDVALRNWSDTAFNLRLERTISLLAPDRLPASFPAVSMPDGIKTVAYKSRNTLTNTGDAAMTTDGGLISMWILCQYVTEGDAQAIVPYVPDSAGGSGPIVKSDYFGQVPKERLQVLNDPPVILFKCDHKLRSKIGLSPQRTTGWLGSMDWKRNILTIAMTPGVDKTGLYANNAWELQEYPFSGDAVNSYNDGPYGLNSCFYELETVSPAKPLKPGEAMVHEHYTLHFQGPIEKLSALSKKFLGVDLTTCPHL